MAELGPVKTFSIGFEGGRQFDERAAAAQVARHLGTSHCERLVTDEDAAASVPGLVSRMDEPLADYAVLPTFFLAEAAAREVKVVLTGEGADELFGGYRRYRKERWLAPLGPWRTAYQASHLFSDSEISRMLGQTARHPGPVSTDEPSGLDSLNRLLWRDLEGWLADDLLVKVDRMTMLSSIEARVPYLDHTFVEFALGIPAHRKAGWLHGRRKMILRESGIGLLPPDVLNRPKHGFTPPIDAWFRGRLGAFAREVLLDPSSELARRIGSRVIRELLSGQENGRRNGHKLWALLVYDLWSQHYGIA
jgi:asparagine synthase (glutamine-hydrolysing)